MKNKRLGRLWTIIVSLAMLVQMLPTMMLPVYADGEALIVSSNKTAIELAQSLVGLGVTISNAKFTGAQEANGNFTGGSNIVGFESGIVLSTGNVVSVVGPNNDNGKTSMWNTPGDADLTAIGGTTKDAAVLEFDFVPNQDKVNFEYVLSSDEYNEYINFADIFAIFVNGQNVALIPGTTTPVSIGTINYQTNTQYYINNCNFTTPGGITLTNANLNTQMDGLTKRLTAVATVNKDQVNHIKFAIADAGDSAYDSNVFIKAGSLQAGTTPVTKVELASGSLGVAGDLKITGLTYGSKYQVVVDGATEYVKADGTTSSNEIDVANLNGTEITGLTNGKTYKVEEYLSASIPTLSSIAITTPATKLAYKVGDALDIAAIVVTGTYSDGTTKAEAITGTDVAGFDSSAVVGSQTLTVTVGEKTTTYTISVDKADGPALAGVTSSDAANTVTGMTAGMEFSTDGTNWTTYNEGTPNLPDLAGTVALQVRVKATATNNAGAATTFNFTIPTLSSIAITTPATKLAYKVGDALDITAMVVTGTYSDGTTKAEAITGTDVAGFDSSAVVGSQTLTVTVGEKTTTYTISVDKADGPALAGVTMSDAANTVTGMTAGMEFSTDGTNWTTYNEGTPNLPDLAGTVALQVRVKATATNNAGAATTFNFIYVPTHTPTSTNTPTSDGPKIIANVVDTNDNNKLVEKVNATVTVSADGTDVVKVKSSETIIIKQPDGTRSSLEDYSKVGYISPANVPVEISSDGTVQISNIAKGNNYDIPVTYDMGNGQKITIGTMHIAVDNSGNVNMTSNLIDPYGVLTDSLSGEVVSGATVTLYYADTARNKAQGIIPNTVVKLPIIKGFKPNDNQNPQTSDSAGAYGFMVYPNTDYYIVTNKDSYDDFTSRTIPVGNELVKFSVKLNPPVTGVKRIAGGSRVDTAIELAKSEFTGKINSIIFVTAENYPDALTGSVLGYQQNAPILLVGNAQEDQDKVLTYMKKYLNSNGNVFILGGTGVVTENFANQVKAAGYQNLIRLGGANRYETAIKIAQYLNVDEGTPVVIASGENYPDALSVSSAAAINQYPILLVTNNVISDSVKNEIAKIKPSKVYIIGKQGAISNAVANNFKLSGKSACITTGTNFPDALAGSIYAANYNAPIILVDNALTDEEKAYLKNSKLTGLTILGGEGAVNTDVENEVTGLLSK